MDWMFLADIVVALLLALCGPVTAIRLHRKVRGQDTRGWLFTLAISPVCTAIGMFFLMLSIRFPVPHLVLLSVVFYSTFLIGFVGMINAIRYYRVLLQQTRVQGQTGFAGRQHAE